MTLSETASIKFSADHEMARMLFQAIGDGFDRLERKSDALNRKQQGFATSIATVVASYATWQTAIGAATRLLERHNQELEKAAVNARAAEKAAMDFALQAGNFKMTPEAFNAITGRIATEHKMPLETTRAAATQLLSSGFSEADVLEGGVLDEFLRSLQALTQTGRGTDPAQLAKAMTKWLNATRQGRTSKSVAAAGRQVFNLFGATDLQMQDMVDLAGVAAGMTEAGMTPSEILGGYTSILGVAKSPSEAATGIGSIVNILTGAKTNPSAVAALKSAGLKPGDVDLVGERFPDVLDRLAGAVGRLRPEDRMPFYNQLFGRERQSIAAGLVGMRGDVRRASGIMGGEASYEAAIEYYRRTKIAAETRVAAERQLVSEDIGDEARRSEFFRQKRLSQLEAEGAPSGFVTLADWYYSAFGWLPHRNFQNMLSTPNDRRWWNAEFEGRVREENRDGRTIKIIAPTGSQTPATEKQGALKNGF